MTSRRSRALSYGLAVVLAATASVPVRAQRPEGYVAVQADVLPSVADDEGERHRVSELRARVFASESFSPGEHLRLTASGFVEGLVGQRADGRATDVIVQPEELRADFVWNRVDLRVGYSRLVWGTLDEIQPTDVVNPIDVSRFLFEGRAEARLPVLLTRLRWFPRDGLSFEGVLVPLFRRGRFDRLDEETSPFDVTPREACPAGGACVPVAIEPQDPERGWGSVQGGGRVRVTAGRTDVSLSAYRGIEPVGLYDNPRAAILSDGSQGVVVDRRHSRFTMFGGDVETVRGGWGLRGEAAVFPHRRLQAADVPSVVTGTVAEGGGGVDRELGAYRLSGDVIVTHRWADIGPGVGRTNVSIVAAADRDFARETRRLRLLGVYDPTEGTLFARSVFGISLRDNLSLEVSGGLFAGDGVGLLGRFETRDFLYVRLKVFY